MLWHFAAMGCVLPPTGNEVAIYLSKPAIERDNVGAVQSAKAAWSYMYSINNWSKQEYQSIQVAVALEARRREHRRMTKKSTALSADIMRRIINVYGRPRTARAANERRQQRGRLRPPRTCAKRWRSAGVCAPLFGQSQHEIHQPALIRCGQRPQCDQGGVSRGGDGCGRGMCPRFSF